MIGTLGERYAGILRYGTDAEIFESIHDNLKNSHTVDEDSDFRDSSELEQELSEVLI